LEIKIKREGSARDISLKEQLEQSINRTTFEDSLNNYNFNFKSLL